MSFNFIFEEDEDEEVIDLEESDSSFNFEEAIPTKKSALADPEVQAKAREARSSKRRRTKTKDYAGKRADGWSYCCAHIQHLSNLCEREQAKEGVGCTCSCHEERGFDLENEIRRYEDEEYIDLFA